MYGHQKRWHHVPFETIVKWSGELTNAAYLVGHRGAKELKIRTARARRAIAQRLGVFRRRKEYWIIRPDEGS